MTFLCLYCCTLSAVSAQSQDTIKIAVQALYYNNQVFLRWAPMDIPSWKLAMQHGFRVERKTLRSEGQLLTGDAFDGSLTLITENAVMLNESAWEIKANNNDLAGIAAGAVYGDSLDILPAGGNGVLQIYNKARELENRFGFSLFAADQDFDIAVDMGLATKDIYVNRFNEYIYYITSRNGNPVTGGVYPFTTNQIGTTTIKKPTGVKATPGDKLIQISWQPDGTTFSSFSVLRSEEDKGIYTKINPSPLMFATTTGNPDDPMVYTDSLADNGLTYYYRVVGKTPFGIESPVSDSVFATSEAGPLQFQMSVTNIQETTNGDLQINWDFPASLESVMTGFEILRSGQVDGEYSAITTALLPMSTRSFTDPNPISDQYYVLKTYDQKGRAYQTFPYIAQTKDDTPPVQPQALTGECSATGMVTLRWARNPDPDVVGYRVFMSSVAAGDYAQITGSWVPDTIFRYPVSSNTLSEEMFFTIKAVDRRENQSIISAPVLVMRPDRIPPAPPVITSARATMAGVRFTWDLSPAKDVVSHTLQRRNIGVNAWNNVMTFPDGSPQLLYTDSSASPRKRYEYRLLATDDAGLQSSSDIVKIKPVDNGLRSPILNFTAQLNTSGKSVLLTWSYANDPDLIAFEVFRAVIDTNRQRSYAVVHIPSGQGGSSPYVDAAATLNGNLWQCSFTDSDIQFDKPQVTQFVGFPNSNGQDNLSVPGQQASTGGTYVVNNPNNMAGQSKPNPDGLYYWVIARYADGATSPVAGWKWVGF